jgi:DNA-binding NarL/FixJ family response regulator
MGTTRVILAEDHALMRDAVKLVFDEAEDVELVGEVGNGNELLPLMARVACDFVLLDVQLPGLDGLGCLEALAKRYPRVKVAMLSAVEDPQVIESAFRRGARGYILKSVNPFDLPAAIRQIVDESVIHRSLAVRTAPRVAHGPPVCPRRSWACSSSSCHGHTNKQIATRSG